MTLCPATLLIRVGRKGVHAARAPSSPSSFQVLAFSYVLQWTSLVITPPDRDACMGWVPFLNFRRVVTLLFLFKLMSGKGMATCPSGEASIKKRIQLLANKGLLGFHKLNMTLGLHFCRLKYLRWESPGRGQDSGKSDSSWTIRMLSERSLSCCLCLLHLKAAGAASRKHVQIVSKWKPAKGFQKK